MAGKSAEKIQRNGRSAATEALIHELFGGQSAVERVLWDLGDLVSIQDLEFNIIYQNRAMKEKFGDLGGLKCFTAYERKTNCEDCYLTRAFATGEVIHAIRIGVDKENSVRFFEVTASPLTDRKGRIFAGVEVLRDISEKKLLEEDLARKKTALEERNKEMIRELQLARNIQQALIPPPEFTIQDLEFNVRYQPFDLVGGDLVEAHSLPDGKVLMAIADVSGHGVASSLVASMLKSSITGLSKTTDSPKIILKTINDQMVELLENVAYLTMALAVYDPETRELTWCTAGHPPIMLQSSGSEIEYLISHAIFAGYSMNADYSDSVTSLNRGDRLIFITDGLYECFNTNNEMYGEERLHRVIKRNRFSPAPALCEQVFRSQRRFIGHHPLSDDAALMVVDVK